MTKRPATALTLFVLLTTVAVADLPPDGWPQARRDARLTGSTPETAIQAPFIAWTTDTGATLTGEPVINSCGLFITNGLGETVNIHTGTGVITWRSPEPYALGPTAASSDLAVDDSGPLLVGLPADAAIFDAWLNARQIQSALDSYFVDYAYFPRSLDLDPVLIPDFLPAMPWNWIAMRPMIVSATPSPGDYRYEDVPPDEFILGIWGTDGGFITGTGICDVLPPSWPRSTNAGGTSAAIDVVNGMKQWRLQDPYPGVIVTPAVGSTDVVWSSMEETNRRPDYPFHGRLRSTDVTGNPFWEKRTWGPLRGGAARELPSGRLFVARGPDTMATYINLMTRTLSSAIESYVVDNGIAPAAGDPESHLIPIYMACMPRHPVDDRVVVFSPTPSPGDYDYTVSPARDSYEIAIWDEDGNRVAIMRDGNWVSPAVDGPPGVLAVDSAGALLWRTKLGTVNNDVGPVALRSDEVVMVGTRGGEIIALDANTGIELWSGPTGGPVSSAPAITAANDTIVLTENGYIVAATAGGAPRWIYPTSAAAQASPTVTSDGVIYAPGLDGILRAIDSSGALLWTLNLGGVRRAGLTTAAIQTDGWVFVGRNDGVVIGLAPAATGGGPNEIGNTFLLYRDNADVVFTWTNPAAGVPFSCYQTVRKSTDKYRFPTDPLVVEVPLDAPRDPGAARDPIPLWYYRVHPTTCCGVDGP